MKFPHLVTYSAYSAHYGVCTPDELAAAAAAHGASHLGLADRDGLYGAVKHVRACLAAGLAPVVGADLALADPADREIIGRVVLLARGHDAGGGYGDLCGIVSQAHAPRRTEHGRVRRIDAVADWAGPAGAPGEEGTGPARPPGTGPDPLRGRPRVTAALIARAVAAGTGRFVILLGPDSDVGRLAAARKYRQARAALRTWVRLVGSENLRVNVVHHLTRPGTSHSVSHAARLLDLAQESGAGAVMTNAVRYAHPDQAVTADVLDAARGLSALGGRPPSGIQANGQSWLKPPEALHRAAAQVCAAAALPCTPAQLAAATAELAEECALVPATDLGLGQPTVPEAHLTGAGAEAGAELRARCEEALHRIYGARAGRIVAGPGIAAADRESPRARMDRELGVIEGLGFSSYFLTVAHVSRLIGRLGIRHAARGSGVSSLVNYLLGVSVVDPLEYGLVFERFLSARRSTLPDVDIDVESARRHEIYRAVFDHYGSSRVTLMSMHNGYRARGAVRDAARALGLPEEQTDRIAKAIWRIPAGELRELLPVKPELRELRAEAERDPAVNLLIDLVERLDRLPRHLSMHPCGVVLSNSSLLRRTPVQPSGTGLPMSQFDKHDMDPMGLLKLDVLGVRMQSAMAWSLEEIERTEGRRPVLEEIDVADPQTFELIRSTETLGCFQIESPGQRELIGKMQPTEVGDLIADISLFRPGPMKSDMVRPFLESRHGFATPHYLHPDLVPYLEETSGVMIYHEQILHVLSRMTGCDLASSDEYRRMLGSPREAEVEEFFRTRAARNGYSPEVIENVWKNLAAFGSFGFCKAHGAAFAIPTYQSAWLKTHYPAQFLAGLLEHDPGMYPQRLLLAEARRLGLRILPLDVNRSDLHFRAERTPDGGWGLRLPLTQLAGAGRAEIRRIVEHAPYASVADLKDRARPHRPTLERLAALGALDARVFAETPAPGPSEATEPTAVRTGPDRSNPGRPDLVRPAVALQLALPLDAAFQTPYRDRQTADLTATLRTELDLLGLDASAHLMAGYAPRLADWPLTRAKDLLGLRNRSEVWVAGVRVSTMTPPMRSGKRVVFISVDDGTGCVDAAFFGEAQEATGPVLFGTPMLLIRGTTRRTGPRGISLTAEQAWDLTALLEGRAEMPFRIAA